MLRVALPRPVSWLLDDPRRAVTLMWLLGLMTVGLAQSAVAQNGIIVGPDLRAGGPPTLFEAYGPLDYKLLIKPDDDASGWFNLGKLAHNIVGWLNNLLLWISLGLLYGALALLQWMLALTIYQDNAGQIDLAVRVIADHVFWPLIGVTVGIGALISYAKWRGDGREFVGDIAWVLSAAVLGAGFAAGPSTLVGLVDQARQMMANGIIDGTTGYLKISGNPVGFADPDLSGNTAQAGSRKLTNGLWSTFGGTPWCLAMFSDVEICKVAGRHALANDDTWRRWMKLLDDEDPVPEFKDRTDWIRGQDPTRTGMVAILLLVILPLAFHLLKLVVAGLMAIVGWLLVLIIGLVFLTWWPIPGWCREMGVRYWTYLLGLQLQALFITAVVAAVMVIASIITASTHRYGFFMVSVLNIMLLVAAARTKAWLDMLTTVGGGSSMGYASALLLNSALRGTGRAAMGMLGYGMSKASGAAAGLRRELASPQRVPASLMRPGRVAMRPALDSGPTPQRPGDQGKRDRAAETPQRTPAELKRLREDMRAHQEQYEHARDKTRPLQDRMRDRFRMAARDWRVPERFLPPEAKERTGAGARTASAGGADDLKDAAASGGGGPEDAAAGESAKRRRGAPLDPDDSPDPEVHKITTMGPDEEPDKPPKGRGTRATGDERTTRQRPPEQAPPPKQSPPPDDTTGDGRS
ncbi:hypothetical protein M8C13_07400 [Crossiella sp. SN42]|uniref:hypothetical protein n=1 Tax=Crossiella sp. SN42 TaxID=2944808 RepID=UPI00207CDA93|nr:hypothetical protein [Crossiella sp. SN42]MCO1575583.1 hypothetical protein [Crossiella sp. SN42]